MQLTDPEQRSGEQLRRTSRKCPAEPRSWWWVSPVVVQKDVRQRCV